MENNIGKGLFYKVNICDLKEIIEYSDDVDLCSQLTAIYHISTDKKAYNKKYLRDNFTYFYLSKEAGEAKPEDGIKTYGWMPGDEKGFDYMATLGYHYQGELFSLKKHRRLKLDKINENRNGKI